ncbi:hypothetical protein [Sphingopyxis chilensis]
MSMRDICGTEHDSGVWGLLGAQLRRLSGGTLNRSRTHLMALLVDEALQHGDARGNETGILADAIKGPTIGGELHFSWSGARETEDGMLATVRLVAGQENQFLKTGIDLMSQFSLLIHRNGVAFI